MEFTADQIKDAAIRVGASDSQAYNFLKELGFTNLVSRKTYRVTIEGTPLDTGDSYLFPDSVKDIINIGITDTYDDMFDFDEDIIVNVEIMEEG